MTLPEYLRSLPELELVKHYDELSAEDESGWLSFTMSVTPYGTLSKKLVEREIDRRVKSGDSK
jgi:hypothetical protein